jgi:hypothetical protein
MQIGQIQMKLRSWLIQQNCGKKKRCKLAHWQSCSEPYFRLPSTLGCEVSRSPAAMEKLLLLWSRLLLVCKAGVRPGSKLVLELLDPARGVNELEFARVERMANIANVDFQLFSSATGLKAVPTTTTYLSFKVLWMNAVFHASFSVE